jgi:hypothetical protein
MGGGTRICTVGMRERKKTPERTTKRKARATARAREIRAF